MPRTIINLTGKDWLLKYKDKFLPAEVSGNVHLDLLNNKIIDELFYGKNIEKAQWIPEKEWVYKKQFNLNNIPTFAHLIFYGIDYLSTIHLNDKKLLTHLGMFSKIVCDVSDILRNNNELVIVLHSLTKFKNRIKTLKAQVNYGWDIAPRLLTQGIWDNVELILTDNVFIEDVFIRSSIKDNKAEVHCEIVLRSKIKDKIDVIVRIAENETHLPLILTPPSQQVTTTIEILNPKYWHPYEFGPPYLYTAEVIIKKDDEILDNMQEQFGIRKIVIDNNLKFFINDNYLFIRGANLVPLSILPGGLRREHYIDILKKVKEANINLLRIWGGGLREKKDFYQVCDTEGILIWQELPFACIFFNKIPTTKKYLEFIEQEVTSIVKQLFNHPCVALYCGGNEFSKRHNMKVINHIGMIINSIDGTRYFHPVSPDLEKKEKHNWLIWHNFSPISDYKKDETCFASEFGLQAFPNIDSIKKFIPEDKLDAINPSLLYLSYDFGLVYPHVLEKIFKLLIKKPASSFYYYHNAQLLKIFRYAKVFDKKIDNLPKLIQLSQLAQQEGLKLAIEHYRRRKGKCNGCIIWQLNDVWPCISWSIIDYYGVAKSAYYMLKDVYNPVILSLQYDVRKYHIPDEFTADIFIINDLLYDLNDCIIEILTANNKSVYKKELNIERNSVKLIDKLTFKIDNEADLQLYSKILKENKIISKNYYTLNYEDNYRIRLLEWLYNKAVSKIIG